MLPCPTSTPGYGAAALQRLRDVVLESKANDPMAQVTVIVPNNIAGIVARRHLAPGTARRPGIAGIEFTTLDRLADRIATPRLAPRRPATRAVLAAAWRRVLTQDPGEFDEIAAHPATVRALVRAHAALRDISDDARAALGGTSAVCADLVRLHERVRGLTAEHWYDDTDASSTATRHVGGAGVGRCVLFLPQELNRAQTTFARALAQGAGLTVVAGLTGNDRADGVVKRTLRALGAVETRTPEVPTATEVINASDSDDEVRCVLRELMTTLRATPAHRVAVLYTNPRPYARLLHEQLKAARVQVNGTGHLAADERAIARFLLQILALADRGLPRAELFRALSGVSGRQFDGERIPLSRWERLSRTAGVVSHDDWDGRLSSYIDDQGAQRREEQGHDEPRGWKILRCEQQIADAEELRTFANRLQAQLRRGDGFSTWAQISDWALELFTTLVGEPESLQAALPSEELYAATATVSILRSLAALDGIDVAPDVRTLRDVLETELAAARPRVGRYGEGVFVGPVSAAVGLDLDVVYVVGASEDLYPGRIHGDALLPDRAREATRGELPDQREGLEAKHRHLLAAFGSAPRVVVSFARGDLRRSSKRLPSRWLMPTLRELSGDDTLPATEWDRSVAYGDTVRTAGSFAGELAHCTELATEQEWRVRQTASAGTLEDRVVLDAVDMLAARSSDRLTRFDGNLAGVEALPDYSTGDTSISPTALESYAECPHSFLVERLLGVKAIELPENITVIKPNEIGNMVHECMDQLVTECADGLPCIGEPWTAAQHARLMEIFAERAARYEDRGLTGHPRLWNPERERIMRDGARMLDADDEWRHEHGVSVIASELPFGMKGKPPVAVPIPGGTVSFRGSADLVGRSRDGSLFVIDIKTGSARRFTGITEADPVRGGTKLQLPVYAYAARQQFGRPSTRVDASYWFVRKDLQRIALGLTPQVEQRYAQTIATLVRSIAAGLFPAKAPDKPDFSWVQCEYCNPDGIGHTENRVRWERKRRDPLLKDLVALVEAEEAVS